ncbi:glycosyltransferase [Mycolicibacterium holsaticum]|uniref:glycosyltransferase n=1 Tax=Mycolicibacterium holsaticum TaxID=152142 RepID=UPI001C7D71DA|nr:nucleotide disphospho-sugar-binding domain-containing protein [Mycolicibacterium holsaticum]MDA4110885.1 glycosyl transferase family 1 [Mycolicibacterium holsaticum DSM 44478 = JCM 12374]QZA12170.1 glycosyltransferase [Mycolicibacterium holsaticum DSM 44478 = JCM 12374]UNC10344.1 glycosyltransferase [Mycolicibacterium holsaticum DSM 44478 = JCM 12374]
MKFVLASWGSRGDIEPNAAVGRELMRRGHEVCIAVPPDLIGFTEAAGLPTAGFGPNSGSILDAHRDFWTCFFRTPWRVRAMIRSRVAIGGPLLRGWQEMSTTLMSLADGADLIFTGINFEDAAANVAEHYDIPLATLHYFPLRPNGQVLTFLPAAWRRSAVAAFWWLSWRVMKKVEHAQRRELGLPRAKGSAPRRITQRRSLEIQAYDAACFPGLAAEWTEFADQRPFVGTLTLELATAADEEVATWIAAGTPPIFFGFGSIPVESPADTIAMISAACAQLGERALIGAAGTDYSDAPHPDNVKVVGTMNYSTVFPACRALVHHGGSSTTPIGMRAGVPQLILYWDMVHAIYGAAVKRLRVGTARRFSTATEASLVADLRTILAPDYHDRARALAAQITPPAHAAAAAADRLEDLARRYRRS